MKQKPRDKWIKRPRDNATRKNYETPTQVLRVTREALQHKQMKNEHRTRVANVTLPDETRMPRTEKISAKPFLDFTLVLVGRS